MRRGTALRGGFRFGAIIHAMFDPADAPDPDLVYANYLKTCAMLGIEPTPREQALDTLFPVKSFWSRS